MPQKEISIQDAKATRTVAPATTSIGTQITHDAILQGQCCSKPNLTGFDRQLADTLYYNMLRIRRMELALSREYHPADEIRCPVHLCVGQESVSAALSQLLRPNDYMFSHHRSHGYYLAKHAPMNALFAELYGRETGANGGRAGSQDISSAADRYFSGAILAGAVAIGVGTAFGEQLRGSDNVVVTGCGEAATEEGVFWEAIGFAARNRLPVVFVCENNRYSTFSPQRDRQVADNLHERVAAFRLRSEAIFANDVVTTYRTLASAIEQARAGQGPVFVEAYTYRWNGHVGPGDDAQHGYRTVEELAYWKSLCPIKLLEESLTEAGWFDEAMRATHEGAIDKEIDEAFRFAKSSPFPSQANWAALNLSTVTPEADRLLQDLEGGGFNQYQADTLPGPY